ncbi:MAG: hypothetical protein KC435_08855 [Thermomicrobiales bacterium]|nr:hypothetical protein [Thermomicrobiales bacterium]
MRRSCKSLVPLFIAVLGILVGHDVVMAMDPHEVSVASHHERAVPQCGPDYHSASQARLPLLPISTVPTMLAMHVVMSYAVDSAVPDQITTIGDASHLRALLQVFLI